MSDPRADRDAYLDRVGARLRLPGDEASDVLEELRGHLAESTASLVGEGLTAEQAERESIARLGDPGELADGIRTARQTRRRMLAAAGAGAVAATGGLVWGWLFATAVTVVAAVSSTLIISFALKWLGLSSSGWQPPDILSIPFALFVPGYAAFRMVGAMAERSRRSVASIQRPIALLGGLLLGIVVVFVVRSELDQLKVVSLLASPLGFAGGALLARDETAARLRRLPGRWVVAILVVTTVAFTTAAVATLRINPAGEYTVDDGIARIGPPATDVLGAGWLDQQSSTGLGFVSGVTLMPEPPTLLRGWRDLRLEAWPLVDRDPGTFIDPTADAPAATAPMVRDAFGSYAGQLDLGTSRDRRRYGMATTGIAPDGNRYLLSGPDGPVAVRPWSGTVWEWFTTP
jgi:hypothetical protein